MSKIESSETAFGQYLQKIRKDQRFTQVDLSKESQLSKSYISFLESGVRHPSRDVVLRLACALDKNNQSTLRDDLLVLAGFAPENPHYRKDDLTKSKKSSLNAFQFFLKNTLALIRQGQYSTAESSIEQGFSQFNQPAQLQTLLAHLELSRENYKQAIVLQKAAIAQLNLSPESSEKGLSQIDFILNLGVMYFLQGDQLLFEGLASSKKKKVKKLKGEAIIAYTKALEIFEEGLSLEPNHLYLLDEMGRVQFNLADLYPEPESARFWKASARYFLMVLEHPHRDELELDTQIESAVFMALAYAKLDDFHSASLLLQALSIQTDSSWLLWYVKACFFSLYFSVEMDPLLLDRSLTCLRKACELNPDLREQAQLDSEKDLQALFDFKPQDFHEVIS